jgi:hypothetical protein
MHFGIGPAHPAVEALTVDIGCCVNSICQGAVSSRVKIVVARK